MEYEINKATDDKDNWIRWKKKIILKDFKKD